MSTGKPAFNFEDWVNDPALDDAQREFRRYLQEAVEEDQAGSQDAAMLAAMQMLATAADAMDKDTSPSARLIRRKTDLEAACDWRAVRELQRELIRYAETDARREHPEAPHYAPAMAAKAWEDLAGLQLLFGEFTAARESAGNAVAAARQTDLSPMVVTALQQEARCLLRLGQPREAVERAQTALETIETQFPFTETIVARTRLLLARCLTAAGDPAAARAQLELARPEMERPGFHREALWANAREVEGEIAYAGGRTSDAIRLLRESVDLRRRAEQAAFCGQAMIAASVASTLERIAELLAAAGDSVAAVQATAKAAAERQRYRLPSPGNTN